MTDTLIPSSDHVVSMADYRQLQAPGVPKTSGDTCVWYDLAVCHHEDGTIQTWVKGLTEHPDATRSMILALRQAANGIEEKYGT